MPEMRLRDDDYIPPAELIEAWQEHPQIVKLGNPILRQVAAPVARILNGETQGLIERMKSIMDKANGLGLAAPQIGVSQRIIVYEIDDKVHVIVNPVISGCRGEQTEPLEGCLSIPGLQGQVTRFNELRIRGQDQRGRPISRKAVELEARVIQHEVDHLDGILFIDRAEPETIAWIHSTDDDEMNAAPHD
jgi:peptide deformylase